MLVKHPLPANEAKMSSICGRGYCTLTRAGFTVTLKSPQMGTFSSFPFLIIGTIGVVQSLQLFQTSPDSPFLPLLVTASKLGCCYTSAPWFHAISQTHSWPSNGGPPFINTYKSNSPSLSSYFTFTVMLPLGITISPVLVFSHLVYIGRLTPVFVWFLLHEIFFLSPTYSLKISPFMTSPALLVLKPAIVCSWHFICCTPFCCNSHASFAAVSLQIAMCNAHSNVRTFSDQSLLCVLSLRFPQTSRSWTCLTICPKLTVFGKSLQFCYTFSNIFTL